MGRIVKAAAVQASPVFMDKKKSVEKFCSLIEEAGKEGADLIVTPETAIPAYPYWRGNFGYTNPEKSKDWRDTVLAFYENSIGIPSPETEQFCKAAKHANAHCVIGINEQDDRVGSRTLFNTQLFISRDGEIMGRHRKTMPTHQERYFWGMGDARDIRVFETDIGRVGGLICFENHMILMRAALAAKGEEIHACCWPGYWTVNAQSGVRDMSGKSAPLHASDQDCCVREYAFETQTFVVSSSLYLPSSEVPDSFPFKQTSNFDWAMGGSCIAGPLGSYLAEPVFNEETIVYADLDMDDRIVAKNIFDCMGHYSRWDLVTLNIREEGWEPVQGIEKRVDAATIPVEKLERVAKKFKLSPEDLESILKELHLS
jgi:amidase/nitrilase